MSNKNDKTFSNNAGNETVQNDVWQENEPAKVEKGMLASLRSPTKTGIVSGITAAAMSVGYDLLMSDEDKTGLIIAANAAVHGLTGAVAGYVASSLILKDSEAELMSIAIGGIGIGITSVAATKTIEQCIANSVNDGALAIEAPQG